MEESAQLTLEADKLRAANVLGRGGSLSRLFDFLLQQSLAGRAPKELEIAVEVFGKPAHFDVSQDATIRVHVHKLRRRLDEHYAAAGRDEPARLIIPRGEYRLAVEPQASAPSSSSKEDSRAAAPRRARTRLLAAALALSLLGNAWLLAARWGGMRDGRTQEMQVREHPLWARLLDDDLPIYIVVGDYYIFGETGDSMEVRRLVREFNVNSREDLERHLRQHPERAGAYQDLDLSYLPTAAAFALRDLIPILATKNRRVEIVLTSELTAPMLKSAHIVYVGYLSGMGMLHDLAFADSRFSQGETFDELIDSTTGRTYVSQAGSPVKGEIIYHDYGYLASLHGPGGNQILVVAGTRDVAVMHTAEALASAAKLAELTHSAGAAPDFEALYEVSGIDRMNVSGRLLTASPLPRRAAASSDPR